MDDRTPAAYTIPGFCRDHNISEPVYYRLKREGIGPVEMRIGSMVRITREAAAEWRRKRENPQNAEAESVKRSEQERRERAHKAARSSLASANHISKRGR